MPSSFMSLKSWGVLEVHVACHVTSRKPCHFCWCNCYFVTFSPVVLDAQFLHEFEVLGILVVHVACHITSVVVLDETGMREGVPHARGTTAKVPSTLNL
jgi:hypothetical protein